MRKATRPALLFLPSSALLRSYELFQARLAAAVGKGQADWLALVDHAIRKMRRDGSLSELSYKWYGRDLTVWRW